MKNAIVILVLGLLRIDFTLASEEPYKAHFTLYPMSLYEKVSEAFPNKSNDEILQHILSRYLDDEVSLKKAIYDTDSLSNAHWVYFGPYGINYQEVSESKTITDIYGSLTNEGYPLKRGWDSLKAVYGMETINPFVMTDQANFVKKGENIMIRTPSKTLSGYAGTFLTMVNTREEKNTLGPMYIDLPQNHPKHKTWVFGTLGVAAGNGVFPVFAHKDSILYQYENIDGENDEAYLPLGDDDHNVLDPNYGWDLSVVMNDSGANLGFETIPDTLTIKQGKFDLIKIFPGWNDKNIGKILYIAGERIVNHKGLFENENYCGFDQSESDRNYILGGYAVNIPYMQDAFALEYILVQFVEHLEVPGLEVSDDIVQGETFTVSLTGTPELMTSWIPEISITGVETELVRRDGYVWTYRALEEGSLTVTLYHNSLRVLPDESVMRSVGPNSVHEANAQNGFEIYPNPVRDHLTIQTDHVLTQLQIIDLQGNIWKEISPMTSVICVEDLPQGVYSLRIKTLNNLFIHKFIKH